MLDLRLRLKNAQEFRQRLLAILEKTGKIHDALAVEKELQRVSETVEQLKGRINYLETNVAFSTLRVEANSPVPQQNRQVGLPFPWVEELARDMGTGQAGGTFKPSVFAGRIRCELPEGYIVYFEGETMTRAMSADNVLICIRKNENFKGGNLEFWSRLVRRVLSERKAILIKDEKAIRSMGVSP